MTYSSSTTDITDNVIVATSAVLSETLSDSKRATLINQLGLQSSRLERFVRGYEGITDPHVSTDDEILNWVFGEVPADLAGAIWLLASGYYKASASSLRNAFDIATASLYFQIRENKKAGPGYNRLFSEWDRGERQTPNWGEMKSYISSQQSVVRFAKNNSYDPVATLYDHFKYLCSYTHTSAFAAPGTDPVTAINMTGVAPTFHLDYFQRGCELVEETISLIAFSWQLVYPQIYGTKPLGQISSEYKILMPGLRGTQALSHK